MLSASPTSESLAEGNASLLGFRQLSPSIYELETDFGWVTACYGGGGVFHLENIFVEPEARGEKHGLWLAEQAKALAINLGATTLQATIVSREGYEVARSIFGVAYLEVHALGHFGQSDYEPTSPTNAKLVYPLQ